MLLAAALWLAPSAAAWAEDVPAAQSGAFDTVEEQVQRHVVQARAHFNTKRFDQSIQELSLAYGLQPNPVYLFSIAQCHRRAGRPRQALSTYQLFLQRDLNSPLRGEATNYVAELVAIIKEQDRIEREKHRPLWKKAWFWGVLGSATAAAGVVLGVGLWLGLRDDSPIIMPRF